MATIQAETHTQIGRGQWVLIGLAAAVASVIAVLLTQAAAIAVWPEIALFKPLESFARTALFTLIPVVAATALFAWLGGRQPHPERAFIKIAAVVLILSIIPDYLLPVEHKTFLASSITALLHVAAAAVTVTILVAGYRQQAGR
jgi:magnesium-transporting ATPase (P-type)